jgi:hypothetical protein
MWAGDTQVASAFNSQKIISSGEKNSVMHLRKDLIYITKIVQTVHTVDLKRNIIKELSGKRQSFKIQKMGKANTKTCSATVQVQRVSNTRCSMVSKDSDVCYNKQGCGSGSVLT